MSEDKAITELMKIKGINKKDAQRLFEAGIKSIKKLGQSIPDELANATGIPKKKLTTWIILSRARERKKFLEVDSATAELSQLLEIKMDDAKRLVAAGVMSINDLAEESADLLSEDTGIEPILVKEWIKKAKAIRKIPPDKRKIKKVVPTISQSGWEKFSGSLIGKKASYESVYQSGNFGAGFILLIIGSALLGLYLTITNYDLLIDFFTSVPILGDYAISITKSLQFYWLWFIVIIGGFMIGWLLISGIVSGIKDGEFSKTAAVMGFGATPGLFFVAAIAIKFIDSKYLFGIKQYFVPILAGIVSLWVLIILIRGASSVPK
ncbi:MAG: DUF4332 domain-containing protein [Candidatus Lokiarchaeota archaeon]|nr:DUF4332 domain-containing protein [Candidatus Lokiarchaeota archaeon]